LETSGSSVRPPARQPKKQRVKPAPRKGEPAAARSDDVATSNDRGRSRSPKPGRGRFERADAAADDDEDDDLTSILRGEDGEESGDRLTLAQATGLLEGGGLD